MKQRSLHDDYHGDMPPQDMYDVSLIDQLVSRGKMTFFVVIWHFCLRERNHSFRGRSEVEVKDRREEKRRVDDRG